MNTLTKTTHKRGRRFAALVVCAAALAVAVTGCGSSSDSSSDSQPAGYAAKDASPQVQKLIDGANKEGALDLNWFSVNPKTMTDLLAAYKNAYGLKIQTKLTPKSIFPANLQEMLQEQKAGKAPSSDAYLGVQDQILAGGPEQENAFKIVDWKGTDAEKYATSDSAGVAFMDQIPVFTYNTTKMKESEVPKTIQDAAKTPQPWTSTYYSANFNLLGATLGKDGVTEYMKTLKPKGFISCGQLDRVATGEFTALWINCGKNIADILIAKGAPLKSEVLEGGGQLSTWYGAVPSKSAHPNAAALWINYLNTPEAQKILFRDEKADNTRIAGSETEKQVKGYEDSGVKFSVSDYEFAKAHPELFDAEYTGELGQILVSNGK